MKKIAKYVLGLSLLSAALFIPSLNMSAADIEKQPTIIYDDSLPTESGQAYNGIQAKVINENNLPSSEIKPMIVVSAGGGTHDYGQRFSLGRFAQYSDYYHPSKFHRSTAYQNGTYYYYMGSPNAWTGGGTWAKIQAPYVWSLNTYNSYWATK